MAWFSSRRLGTMDDLLRSQVACLYDIEIRLVDLLPRVADGARDARLQLVISEHAERAKIHVDRLIQAFAAMGAEPERETSHAMRGLVYECEMTMSADGDRDVLDAGLVACLRNIEAHEDAGYRAALGWAESTGREDVATLLRTTMNEEAACERDLAAIASGHIHVVG